MPIFFLRVFFSFLAFGGLLSLSKSSFALEAAAPLNRESAKKEKKWGLSGSSSLARGAHYSAKSRWSGGLSFSYEFSKISAGVEGAYILPLSRVTNVSSYGLTDISLSLSRVFGEPAGRNISAGGGVSLPTSRRAVRQSKYSSLYGWVSHSRKRGFFQLIFRQVFYWGLYGSRSDKSGFISNPLLSSSSDVSAVAAYKEWRFSAAARLYLYMYAADRDRDPSVEQIKFRLNGNQGGYFQALYRITENWNVRGRVDLNIPVVSPVLTGAFPLLRDRNLSWSLGTALKL